jgi:hypothetical protein
MARGQEREIAAGSGGRLSAMFSAKVAVAVSDPFDEGSADEGDDVNCSADCEATN